MKSRWRGLRFDLSVLLLLGPLLVAGAQQTSQGIGPVTVGIYVDCGKDMIGSMFEPNVKDAVANALIPEVSKLIQGDSDYFGLPEQSIIKVFAYCTINSLPRVEQRFLYLIGQNTAPDYNKLRSFGSVSKFAEANSDVDQLIASELLPATPRTVVIILSNSTKSKNLPSAALEQYSQQHSVVKRIGVPRASAFNRESLNSHLETFLRDEFRNVKLQDIGGLKLRKAVKWEVQPSDQKMSLSPDSVRKEYRFVASNQTGQNLVNIACVLGARMGAVKMSGGVIPSLPAGKSATATLNLDFGALKDRVGPVDLEFLVLAVSGVAFDPPTFVTQIVLPAAPLQPDAYFVPQPASGDAPLTVVLKNGSTHATSYTWDLGDGRTSHDTSPQVVYGKPGEYSVTLVAVGTGGRSAPMTRKVVVNSVKPVARFSPSAKSGTVPLTVVFTNISLGATSYQWDFGNGESSPDANPTTTFRNVGQFKVTLTASGPGGRGDPSSELITVVPAEPVASPIAESDSSLSPPPSPRADFTIPLKVKVGEEFQLVNTSTDAKSYNWDFGSTSVKNSTDPNPSVTYDRVDTYEVTLTAYAGPGRTGPSNPQKQSVVVSGGFSLKPLLLLILLGGGGFGVWKIFSGRKPKILVVYRQNGQQIGEPVVIRGSGALDRLFGYPHPLRVYVSMNKEDESMDLFFLATTQLRLIRISPHEVTLLQPNIKSEAVQVGAFRLEVEGASESNDEFEFSEIP